MAANRITRSDWIKVFGGIAIGTIGVLGATLCRFTIIDQPAGYQALTLLWILSYLWLTGVFWGLFPKLRKPALTALLALISPLFPLCLLFTWHYGSTDPGDRS